MIAITTRSSIKVNRRISFNLLGPTEIIFFFPFSADLIFNPDPKLFNLFLM